MKIRSGWSSLAFTLLARGSTEDCPVDEIPADQSTRLGKGSILPGNLERRCVYNLYLFSLVPGGVQEKEETGHGYCRPVLAGSTESGLATLLLLLLS